MTPAPFVSIIIPCYNAEPWIAEALESALAQTHPDREIIVVDDGSKDASVDVVRRFTARGVQLVRQPNRGASAARNAGLAAARGDWFQFLDADDLLAPDKIARQLELADRIGREFAFCAQWTRFTTTLAQADFTPQPLCMDAAAVDWLVLKMEQNRMMHPAAWLITRELADKAGPWNEQLSLDDDGEYFTRIVAASRGVRCCPRAMSYYRSRISGSLSGRKSERALASAFAAIESAVQQLLQLEDSPRTHHAGAVAWQRFIYEAYPGGRSERRVAAQRVAHYGGCSLAPEGGPRFQRLSRWVGWKMAKRLQTFSR